MKEREIIELRNKAKMIGLNLDSGNDKPHAKPKNRKCEFCGRKYKIYLYRSNLENNWIWACKRCEERLNYDFYYITNLLKTNRL